MPLPQLILALQNPALYSHAVTAFQVIETHISWVLLTGEYVYKIKKPVNLGFLDFSTLEQRRHYCQRELLLNRRLAPQLYLDVIAISGTSAQPILDGGGTVIEYAVKMRQFPQEAILERLLLRRELHAEHIDQLADTIAAFHHAIEAAGSDSHCGTPEAILEPVEENFRQIEPLLSGDDDRAALQRLKEWSLMRFQALRPVFEQRRGDGFVRNCHGDIHLGNIALIGGTTVIFDCIEFNDNFRWIDTMSEIAFTTMDLISRGETELSARLLDRYLQRSGDYAGLVLLRFYQVYRALVRAKVAVIRASQCEASSDGHAAATAQFRHYMETAAAFTQGRPPRIFIAHGVSGSGKTSLTQPLLERFGMVRLRSDIERKRLFGLVATARGSQELYSSDASQLTYDHLLRLTRAVFLSGFDVIVDATFLKRQQRRRFRALANELGAPFIILHFYADVSLLRHWLEARAKAGRDASDATVEIMERQLASEEPLEEGEADRLITIDTGREEAAELLIANVQ